MNDEDHQIRDAFIRCHKTLDFGDCPQRCFSMLARRETIPSEEELEGLTLARYQALNAVAWLDIFDNPKKMSDRDTQVFNKLWTAMSRNNNTPTCGWRQFKQVCSQVLQSDGTTSTTGFTPIRPAVLDFDAPTGSNVTIKWPNNSPVKPHKSTPLNMAEPPPSHLDFGGEASEAVRTQQQDLSPLRPHETPRQPSVSSNKAAEYDQLGQFSSERNSSKLSDRLERLVKQRQQQLAQREETIKSHRGRSMSPTKSAMRSRSSESDKRHQKVDIQDPKKKSKPPPKRESSSDSSSHSHRRHDRSPQHDRADSRRRDKSPDSDRRTNYSRKTTSKPPKRENSSDSSSHSHRHRPHYQRADSRRSDRSPESDRRSRKPTSKPPRRDSSSDSDIRKYSNTPKVDTRSAKPLPKRESSSDSSDYTRKRSSRNDTNRDSVRRDSYKPRDRYQPDSERRREPPRNNDLNGWDKNKTHQRNGYSKSSSSSSNKKHVKLSNNQNNNNIYREQEAIVSEAHLRSPVSYVPSKSSSSEGVRIPRELFTAPLRVLVDFGCDVGYHQLQMTSRAATCSFKDAVESEILLRVADGIPGVGHLHRVIIDTPTTVLLELKIQSMSERDANTCKDILEKRLRDITFLELSKTSNAVRFYSNAACDCQLIGSRSAVGTVFPDDTVPPRHQVRLLIDEHIQGFEPDLFTSALEEYIECKPRGCTIIQCNESLQDRTSVTLAISTPNNVVCSWLCQQARDKSSKIHSELIPIVECDYFRDYAESLPSVDDVQRTEQTRSPRPSQNRFHRQPSYKTRRGSSKYDGFGDPIPSTISNHDFDKQSRHRHTSPGIGYPHSPASPESFYSLTSSGRHSPASLRYSKSNPNSPRSRSEIYSKSMFPPSFKEPPSSPTMSVNSPSSKQFPPPPTGVKAPPSGRSLSPIPNGGLHDTLFYTPPQSPNSPTMRSGTFRNAARVAMDHTHHKTSPRSPLSSPGMTRLSSQKKRSKISVNQTIPTDLQDKFYNKGRVKTRSLAASATREQFSGVQNISTPSIGSIARNRAETEATSALRSASPQAAKDTTKAKRFMKKNKLSELFS